MALEAYKGKRRFERTPEPQGGISEEERLHFVVQKHRASQLHYDFRLEWGGVLKSWAVPKGPSLNPADKRLAVLVEDHPLDYRLFEGVIPEKNYGAGTVMGWDCGTYRPRAPGTDRAGDERAMQEGFERGHLTFVLDGRKLKGEYSLLRLRRAEENAWLLVKKNDEHADTADVREQDLSVLTGRTMDEIAQGAQTKGQIWVTSEAPGAEVDLENMPEAPMPRAVEPMLASTAASAFDRDGWLFEIKWDGYRAIAEIEPGVVRLYSRSQKPFEQRYPEVVRSLATLRRRAVLDGEIVVLDEEGRPQFQLLQTCGESPGGTLFYYVFDLLYLDGHDLRGEPLVRRKEILREILPPLPGVRYSDHVEENGTALFTMASERELEGIIAKDGASPYRAGRRSSDWLKVKIERRQDAVIAGFTAPRGTRSDLGALILGVYEGEDLVYVGHAGTGFSAAALKRLRSRLDPLIIPTSPFRTRPSTNAPATWVEPQLVCSVTFREWTREGVMRMPVFVGLRDDIPPRAVHREDARLPARPSDPPEQRRTFDLSRGSEKVAEIGGRQVKLTNLKKKYWPGDRLTKGDLISYYRETAPIILPYLVDRPESLHRHPDGIDGESFFQKDAGRQAPDWVRTIDLHSDAEDREISYLLCQDEATLVYMANLGCIEINPWASRIGLLDRPDYLVIDLDPESIAFSYVVETAHAVREVLERCGIDSLVKTSGATGLHIAIPLAAELDYEQAQQLGHIIAQLVHQRLPQWTSLVRSPAQRQGKVYLDYLQNRRGQTVAAPYSVRPRPGAPVSTPLHWEEVTPALDPSAFTIRTIRKRLDHVGDLWEPVLGPGINLERALEAVGDRQLLDRRAWGRGCAGVD